MARVITRGTPPARQWWIGVQVTCRHCSPATVYEIETGDAISHPPADRAAIDAAVTLCPVCGLGNLISQSARPGPNPPGPANRGTRTKGASNGSR